jgi:hypothetical protein
MVLSKVFFPAVFIWDISNNINNILVCIQNMLCVAPSLVVCAVFCRSLLSLCPLSFGYCIVRLSLIYGFWSHLWYLLAIVLSVFLWFTASDHTFGIFWLLYCPSFFDLRLLITPFGIFWPLYCLSFFDLRLLITPLISLNFSYKMIIYCIIYYKFSFNTISGEKKLMYLVNYYFKVLSWIHYKWESTGCPLIGMLNTV